MLAVWGVTMPMYSAGIGIQLVERWNFPLFRSCNIDWKFAFSTPTMLSATLMATLPLKVFVHPELQARTMRAKYVCTTPGVPVSAC